MSHICANCHQRGTGCCSLRQDNNQGYIGITTEDIKRIKEHLNINQEDFIVEEFKSDEEIKTLIKYIHPIFEKLYANNRCFRLKTIDNHCVFLEKIGNNQYGACVLPEEIKPLYCRIYPFWMTPDNNYISILTSNECLAQRESSLSWNIVNKYFNYTEIYVKNLFNQIVKEFNAHAETVKYLHKTELKNNDVVFNFRKIVPTDLPRIKEMCKDIWDGEDYMPHVAEKWIKDKSGEFTGIEINKKIYGLCKLSFQVPEIAWIEGLRADPYCPYKGFANAFYQYYINLIKEKYPKVEMIELASYFENQASNKIAFKYGFELESKASFKFINLCNVIPDFEHKELNVKELQNINMTSNLLLNSDFRVSDRLFIGWTGIPVMSKYHNYLKSTIEKKIIHYIFKEEDIEIQICVNYDSFKKETNIICVSFNMPLDNQSIYFFNKAIRFIIKNALEKDMLIIQTIIPLTNPLLPFIKETLFDTYTQDDDFYLYRKKL